MSTVDGDGYDLADADVGSSRYDLELFVPHVDLANDEFICVRMAVDLKNFTGHYFFDVPSPIFNLFDRNAGHRQFICKSLRVLIHIDVDILLHPC